MTASYRLLPKAEKDLEDIWQTTAKDWGINQAMLYTDKLVKAFTTLAINPKINRERREFDPPVRIHRCEKHLIIYLAQKPLKIIRILHQRMDIDARLKD